MINDLSEFKMFEILWDNFCLLFFIKLLNY